MIYAVQFPEAAILERNILVAFGCQVTVTCVDLVNASTNTAIRSLCTPHVHRATASNNFEIPAQSKMLLVRHIYGQIKLDIT